MSNLPTVDVDFILSHLDKCPKINAASRRGFGSNMIMYVLEGNKPLHKRLVMVTHSESQVDFYQATGLAAKFQFMGALLSWLKKYRNWKEGAYVTVPNELSSSIEDEE